MRSIKKYLFLFIIVLSFLVGCKDQKEDFFVEINQNDEMVKEVLDSFDFITSLNENLIKKLYDLNDTKIEVADLTNDEKMFLTLQKYNIMHDKRCLYHNENICSINEADLKGLLFEQDDFIEEYKIPRKYFNIENNIDLMYNHNIFQVKGEATEDIDTKIMYKDFIAARKKESIIEIDFRIAYLLFDYKMEKSEYEDVLFYKELDDEEPLETKYDVLKSESDFGKLDDKYNAYRLSFLIEGDKLYFKSIGRI